MTSDMSPPSETVWSPVSELDTGTNKDAGGANGDAAWLCPLLHTSLSLLPLNASQQTAQGPGLAVPQESVLITVRNDF